MAAKRLTYLAGLCLSLSAVAALACAPTHRVAPGETLAHVAEDRLGSVYHLPRLAELNRATVGRDINAIAAEMLLDLPCEDPETLDWSVLPNALDLAMVLRGSDLQVIDVRADISGGVLPRTLSLPYDLWPKAHAEVWMPKLVAATGLRLDRPIVVIGADGASHNMGQAAYVYWLLKSAGARQVALLEDGIAAWRAAGLPLAEEPNGPRPSSAALHVRDTWRADHETLIALVTGARSGILLDARPVSRMTRGQSTPGFVPMPMRDAPKRPIEALIRQISGAPSLDDTVTAVLSELNAAPSGPIVSISTTVETAAWNWFLISEVARRSDAMLYPHAVEGWSQDALPLQVGEK
jgi:3-mercaptopyruvate sulfurtransferase SseA